MTDNVIPYLSLVKKASDKVKSYFVPTPKPYVYIDESTLIRIIETSKVGDSFFSLHPHLNMMSWRWDIQNNTVVGITFEAFRQEEVPPMEE